MKTCPFCAEEIQDAAIVCKHCGRELSSSNVASPEITTAEPRKISHVGRNILMGLGALFVIVVISQMMTGSGPSALTAEHLGAVRAAHTVHAWIQPNTVELNSVGFIVAEYVIPDDFAIPPKTLGQTRLLAIREALLPFGFKDYRVNINGIPPGTGLIRRYGSARLIGGGSLEWLTP
jgi:hypothetical protein